MKFTPPVKVPLFEANGMVNREWALFFQNLSQGDPGTLWTPTYSGLTLVGSVVHTGKWYRISDYMQYFWATITSSGGGTHASTAGTTYLSNYPSDITGNGGSVRVSNMATNIAAGGGVAVASNDRIYLPTWAATAETFVVAGVVEAR